MHDEPDPPRRHYQLKEREFDRVNPRAGEAADSAPIDINDLYRSANGTRPGMKPPAIPPPVDNDVLAILRENHARAEAAGLNAITPPPKRKSKRLRDYLVLMVAGNAYFIAGLYINPVFAGAGLVLFNISLTWIIWVVMDKY
jgi:hypothetical protein